MGGVRPMTTTLEFEPLDLDVPRDMWILARTKIKYYGAYPAGLLERARGILCATVTTGEGSRARLFTVWRNPSGLE